MTLAVVLSAIVAVAGCKRERDPARPDPGEAAAAPAEPRPAAPSAAPGGPGAPTAVADAPTPPGAAPAAALPPPSEDLGAVPAELAGKVGLESVARGLRRPVLITAAPGDARGRLFIVEQPGRIRILEGGVLATTAFFNMIGKVSTGNEQGLLGLAFHPRFADNRKLYVHYTDLDDDTHVVEYRVAADDPDRVDMSTAREIFGVGQPWANHNGGHLLFGPDGRLYVGMGDGGAAADPKGAGQDPKNLLGKMLRFDVDAARPKPEIVAIGLRNPWRYAFDAATGALYIGDVGQDAWESIYVVAGGDLEGHNFGWNVAEGRHCFSPRRCDRSAFTAPVIDYPHAVGCSVTGGEVYRGKAIPELDGVYFYADYCTGILRSFRWAPDGVRQHWDWKPVLDPRARVNSVSSFGVDGAGELYIVSLGGEIWKLVRK